MDRLNKPVLIGAVPQPPLPKPSAITTGSTTKAGDPWEGTQLTEAEEVRAIEVAVAHAKVQALRRLKERYNLAVAALPPDAPRPEPDYPEKAEDIVLDEVTLQIVQEDALVEARKARYFQRRQAQYMAYAGRELVPPVWTAAQLDRFIREERAPELKLALSFGKHDGVIYQALLHYFTGNEAGFVETIRQHDYRDEEGKLKNPYCLNSARLSLDRGLAILGRPGTGKTTLMRLFVRNPRAPFKIVRAARFAGLYNELGEGCLMPYTQPFGNDGKPGYYLNHTRLGMLIDDIGTEDVAVKFSKCDTVAFVLLEREERQGSIQPDGSRLLPFQMTHFTSNLSLSGLKTRYGDRLYSRFKGAFNPLMFPEDAPDRR